MQQNPPPQYNYSDSPYNQSVPSPQPHQSSNNNRRQERPRPPYVQRDVPVIWRHTRNACMAASIFGVLIMVIGLLIMTVNTYLSFPLVAVILVFVGVFLFAGAFVIHVFADRQWSGRYFSYARRTPAQPQQNRFYEQQQNQQINQGLNAPGVYTDQQYTQPYVYAQKTSNY